MEDGRPDVCVDEERSGDSDSFIGHSLELERAVPLRLVDVIGDVGGGRTGGVHGHVEVGDLQPVRCRAESGIYLVANIGRHRVLSGERDHEISVQRGQRLEIRLGCRREFSLLEPAFNRAPEQDERQQKDHDEGEDASPVTSTSRFGCWSDCHTRDLMTVAGLANQSVE